VKYETSVKAGKFLLIAHGTADEVEHARNILQNSGAEQRNMLSSPEQRARVVLSNERWQYQTSYIRGALPPVS
jgi:hypothetical protein